LLGVALAIVLSLLVWIAWIATGLRAASSVGGTIQTSGLQYPVRIVRDDRDIPHIYARSMHDLMFAQGYAEASDRLFQMDLIRRYVYGRLAEVMGPAALAADEHARIVDISAIVSGQWARTSAGDRRLLAAFADGVNAAMRTQPLPPEFHILLYRPQPWTPQDTLAVGMATVLDLVDSWDDVIKRDRLARDPQAAPITDLYSITDPRYDAPVAGSIVAPVPRLRDRIRQARHANIVLPRVAEKPPTGSNDWAVGASRSADGRALLANDPHLRLGIPGVWYLIDLHAPGFHAAGAVLAGTPGVILGHNENIAWGVTNATVATESVYRDSTAGATARVEHFHVRFGADRTFTYYRTRHGFVAAIDGATAYAVHWNGDYLPTSATSTFERLDAASSIGAALTALRSYPGPPQNFVIADRSGAVTYHLAGWIPDDPLWGLRAHDTSDPEYPFIPFDRLPQVSPSRAAVVFTANNRTYGTGYPYRLSANFSAPYRAYRISTLLGEKRRLTPDDLSAIQSDTLSIPDREIARATVAAARRSGLDRAAPLVPYLQALANWNGRFDPDARGAAVALEVRRIAVASLARYDAGRLADAYQSSAGNADTVLLMRVLRERPAGWYSGDDYDRLLTGALKLAVSTYGTRLLEPWERYGAVTVRHPLAALGMRFLNGATFPGDGERYCPHVQLPDHAQSFRAVWDVGNWDAGGIVIPSGESGEPGSGHYTDLSRTWILQRLVPLPFSDRAIRANATATLTLMP
jgi:penicillin amidase